MRCVLLTVQYVSIIGLFLESWVIFRRLKNSPLGYLFLSCLATLLSNLGYLFQLLSVTQESYVTALRISYAGRTWITLFLFLFTAELCKIKFPRSVKNLMMVAHLGIYVSVFAFQKHHLFYTWTKFSTDRIFPQLLHGNGIAHEIYMGLQAIYIVVGFAWLFRALGKEKSSAARKRLIAVIVSFLMECIFFAAQTFRLLEITNDYEVTMIGYVIGIVVMFVALFRYDLLGAKEIARDFMIDRLAEGVIAVDVFGNVQYCNAPAKKMYPTIEEDSAEAVARIRGAIHEGSVLNLNGRIYTAEENDLVRNNKNFGKLYVLVDATDHYERFKKEKKILQRELRIDPLTGLYNRNGMEHFSERLYNEALENGKSLLLCICDMNGLKFINDNFGHEEGDRAIRELSQVIKESLLEKDMAFRIGGDEFLILGLREGADEAVADFRSRVERNIAAFNQSLGLPYKVDMSYGPLSKKVAGTPNEFSDLLKESDTLMYEMKKSRDEHKR